MDFASTTNLLLIFCVTGLTAAVLLVVGANPFRGTELRFRRVRSRHIPSPAGLPFLGHVLTLPTSKMWKYFEELFKEYGDIVRLTIFRDEILVLSNPIDAEELLGRRSHNYSSRKPLIYGGKYQSNDKRFVMLPYGPTLKKHRGAVTQVLHPRMIVAYEDTQSALSISLLQDLVKDPHAWELHCKRYSATLAFTLNYGRGLSVDEKELDGVLSILENLLKDTYPGAHLVDSFPALDLLPDFLAQWRRTAKENHKKELELYSSLALEVKDRMNNNEQVPDCLVLRLWQSQKETQLDLEEISYIAGVTFEAGTDTTSATLQWFFAAMVLYPDVLAKAQAELNSFAGGSAIHMPSFKDMDSLPYCSALVKEVLRWGPSVPGGFPHYSDADDEYLGYKIKKHTMVIPCIWNMHHNETFYQDSYSFRPERFSSSESTSRLWEGHYGFGFGRRKCPGMYFASKSLWIAMVRILWAFDIKPAVDKEGNIIQYSPDNCTSGVTCAPEGLSITLHPRSATHLSRIAASESEQIGVAV